MSDDGSVTRWTQGAKQGHSSSITALWQRYFEKLVRHARKKLRGTSRRVADEEDVALSAFNSFCRAAEQGRFPDLNDRDSLWRLLLQMTARKAVDQRRREGRQRRGGGAVRGESVFDGAPTGRGAGGLAQLIGKEPTPEFGAGMAETFLELISQLDDVPLQAMALAKMEGYTNEEIADQLNCSVRTVERRLGLIRKKWTREDES